MLFFATFFFCYSNAEIDSLKNEINTSTVDSVQLKSLFELVGLYTDINVDSTDKYLSLLYSKIDTVNNIKDLARYYLILGKNFNQKCLFDKSLNSLQNSLYLYNTTENNSYLPIVLNLIGNTWQDLLQYDSAIYYYNLSYQNVDTVNQKWLIAANYNNIANSYDSKGNKVLALDHYFKALKIFRETNQEETVAVTLGNIGYINSETDHYEEAIEYLLQAIEINKKSNNLDNLCSNYNYIGITYKEIGNYDKAIEYLSEAVKISVISNFDYTIAQSYHNLGNVYILSGDYHKAEYCINKSLEVSEKLSIIMGLMVNYSSKADILMHFKKYEEAEKYLLNGLKLSNNNYSYEESVNERLKDLYKETQNYKKALEHLEKYVVLNDTIHEMERIKEFNEIKTKYETEQKEIDNKLLKEKTINQELVINRQRIVVIFSILTIIAVVFALILLIISRKRKKEHVSLLSAKNEMINKKTEELDESNKTKDKLFSIISHDLRTPFTGLFGFSSMLHNDIESGITDNISYYSNQILNSTRSTYELIENLLTWSRSQQNKIIPNHIVINLYNTIEEVISSMTPKISNKEINIKIDINKNETLYIDPNILTIIVRNLVNNAIKFTPSGGSIIIGYVNNVSSHVISIYDTGVGFDENVRNKILCKESYTTKGTDNEPGSGLGLLLIKDLLNRIDGTLSISSTLGKGSTFSITIPDYSE